MVNWLFKLVEREKKVHRIKANSDREKKKKKSNERRLKENADQYGEYSQYGDNIIA